MENFFVLNKYQALRLGFDDSEIEEAANREDGFIGDHGKEIKTPCYLSKEVRE